MMRSSFWTSEKESNINCAYFFATRLFLFIIYVFFFILTIIAFFCSIIASILILPSFSYRKETYFTYLIVIALGGERVGFAGA